MLISLWWHKGLALGSPDFFFIFLPMAHFFFVVSLMGLHLHLKHSYYSILCLLFKGNMGWHLLRVAYLLLQDNSTTLSEWKAQGKCKELFLLLVGCCCYYHLVKGIKGSSGMKRLS